MLPIKVSLVLALLCSVPMIGCKQSSFEFAPVSGQVLLDDKPLGGAEVVFTPVGSPTNPNPGPFSKAVTDESGNFTLSSNEDPKVQYWENIESVFAWHPTSIPNYLVNKKSML